MNRQLHFLLRTFIFLAALTVIHPRSFAADFAWQDTTTYRPPDFEGTFPVDPGAGRELEQLWRQYERQGQPRETTFETFRRGLRSVPIDRQMPVLRWFGNQYIWNKSPQNSQGIDLMYHAAGSTNPQISYNAIYFGLSTVRPMTEPILRALVDIAIESEDPNVLSRIAWGGAAQKDRLLYYLKPHLASDKPVRREHAETLRKIFSGELKAFAWAAEQARKKAEAKYSNRLEEFRAILTKGDSSARRELLNQILGERIALIMDETFIPAFAAAATDSDPDVRDKVAIIAGGRWVWNASDQAPEAIDLMVKLSRDPSREVRYNANYYGLSTIRHRTEEEVERMIEMALYDGLNNPDFRGRVTWGLEKSRELVRTVLEKWTAAYKADPIRAAFAYGFHLGFFKENPEVAPELQRVLHDEKPVAHLIAVQPVKNQSLNGLDEYLVLLCKELPPPYDSPARWNTDEMLISIVAPSDLDPIEKKLAAGGNFKIGGDRTLTATNLVDLGKGVRLQQIR